MATSHGAVFSALLLIVCFSFGGVQGIASLSEETSSFSIVMEQCILDCSLGDYWPHPSNCEMYIHCTPYGPQEMPCDAGKRWDTGLLTCNYKSVTPCVTGQYTDEKGISCGGILGSNTSPSVDIIEDGSTPGSEDGNGGGENSGAVTTDNGIVEPEIDYTIIVMEDCILDCSLGDDWPHPSNCEMYIHCTPYGPEELSCGADNRWDQNLMSCNSPSETPCVLGDYVDQNGEACGNGPDLIITTTLVAATDGGESGTTTTPRDIRTSEGNSGFGTTSSGIDVTDGGESEITTIPGDIGTSEGNSGTTSSGIDVTDGGESEITTESSGSSHEGGSHEVGSHEVGSQEVGKGEDGGDESGGDESGSDESGSDESGSDESGSDESGSDESGSDESESDESGGFGIGSLGEGSDESGSDESGSDESGGFGIGGLGSGSDESGSDESDESGGFGIGSLEIGSDESGSFEIGSRENEKRSLKANTNLRTEEAKSVLDNASRKNVIAGDCSHLTNGRYASENESEFYKCVSGVAFLFKCQDFSRFDANKGRCVPKLGI